MSFGNIVQPEVRKHLRDSQNVLALDRCLLNAVTFQCVCL